MNVKIGMEDTAKMLRFAADNRGGVGVVAMAEVLELPRMAVGKHASKLVRAGLMTRSGRMFQCGGRGEDYARHVEAAAKLARSI